VCPDLPVRDAPLTAKDAVNVLAAAHSHGQRASIMRVLRTAGTIARSVQRPSLPQRLPLLVGIGQAHFVALVVRLQRRGRDVDAETDIFETADGCGITIKAIVLPRLRWMLECLVGVRVTTERWLPEPKQVRPTCARRHDRRSAGTGAGDAPAALARLRARACCTDPRSARSTAARSPSSSSWRRPWSAIRSKPSASGPSRT